MPRSLKWSPCWCRWFATRQTLAAKYLRRASPRRHSPRASLSSRSQTKQTKRANLWLNELDYNFAIINFLHWWFSVWLLKAAPVADGGRRRAETRRTLLGLRLGQRVCSLMANGVYRSSDGVQTHQQLLVIQTICKFRTSNEAPRSAGIAEDYGHAGSRICMNISFTSWSLIGRSRFPLISAKDMNLPTRDLVSPERAFLHMEGPHVTDEGLRDIGRWFDGFARQGRILAVGSPNANRNGPSTQAASQIHGSILDTNEAFVEIAGGLMAHAAKYPAARLKPHEWDLNKAP